MALAKGRSVVRSGPITLHTQTAIHVAELMTQVCEICTHHTHTHTHTHAHNTRPQFVQCVYPLHQISPDVDTPVAGSYCNLPHTCTHYTQSA